MCGNPAPNRGTEGVTQQKLQQQQQLLHIQPYCDWHLLSSNGLVQRAQFLNYVGLLPAWACCLNPGHQDAVCCGGCLFTLQHTQQGSARTCLLLPAAPAPLSCICLVLLLLLLGLAGAQRSYCTVVPGKGSMAWCSSAGGKLIHTHINA
jgi:hypothetical protein